MTTKFKALIGFSGLKEDGLVVATTTIVNTMTVMLVEQIDFN
ncbi:hypothetical protein [Sphingobacterium sp. LRF_L2]